MAKLNKVVNWLMKYKAQGISFARILDDEYIDWYTRYRPGLKQFENIHKGGDCFIIGNGPSLNKTNLDLLKDHYVFGLNKIHLIFEKYRELGLSYHVTVNPLVIQQIEKELNSNIFNCPSFISYHASKEFSYSNKSVHKLLTNDRWSFYHTIMEPICEGYTVTYVALQIAYFMGFERVFLVGVDHNFQQKGKPNEQQDFKGDDINHFHPDYFKGQQWHLADLEGNEASYALARHQFHTAGRQIFDATIDGKLQLFDKISFEDAVRVAKRR